MKETEESRERNSPEVYENGVRNTERHKHPNKVSPIADEEGIKSKSSREYTSRLLIVGFCQCIASLVPSVVCRCQAGCLNIERLIFGV